MLTNIGQYTVWTENYGQEQKFKPLTLQIIGVIQIGIKQTETWFMMKIQKLISKLHMNTN